MTMTAKIQKVTNLQVSTELKLSFDNSTGTFTWADMNKCLSTDSLKVKQTLLNTGFRDGEYGDWIKISGEDSIVVEFGAFDNLYMYIYTKNDNKYIPMFKQNLVNMDKYTSELSQNKTFEGYIAKEWSNQLDEYNSYSTFINTVNSLNINNWRQFVEGIFKADKKTFECHISYNEYYNSWIYRVKLEKDWDD